jgi:REP-associated tyrosine transposase
VECWSTERPAVGAPGREATCGCAGGAPAPPVAKLGKREERRDALTSSPLNSLKGVSSRRLRQEFPDLARHYYRANKLWSGSYFAGSVGGAPLSIVRQYIEQQNRPV